MSQEPPSPEQIAFQHELARSVPKLRLYGYTFVFASGLCLAGYFLADSAIAHWPADDEPPRWLSDFRSICMLEVLLTSILGVLFFAVFSSRRRTTDSAAKSLQVNILSFIAVWALGSLCGFAGLWALYVMRWTWSYFTHKGGFMEGVPFVCLSSGTSRPHRAHSALLCYTSSAITLVALVNLVVVASLLTQIFRALSRGLRAVRRLRQGGEIYLESRVFDADEAEGVQREELEVMVPPEA